MIDPNGLLMIEPTHFASLEPVIDELTLKMTAAWRQRRTSDVGYRGFHICKCGAWSDNKDHWVDELLTNSLCIHYVAFHRKDLTSEELAKVQALDYGLEEPAPEELGSPKWRK